MQWPLRLLWLIFCVWEATNDLLTKILTRFGRRKWHSPVMPTCPHCLFLNSTADSHVYTDSPTCVKNTLGALLCFHLYRNRPVFRPSFAFWFAFSTWQEKLESWWPKLNSHMEQVPFTFRVQRSNMVELDVLLRTKQSTEKGCWMVTTIFGKQKKIAEGIWR